MHAHTHAGARQHLDWRPLVQGPPAQELVPQQHTLASAQHARLHACTHVMCALSYAHAGARQHLDWRPSVQGPPAQELLPERDALGAEGVRSRGT